MDLGKLKGFLVNELTPARGHMYHCPLCGSGSGANKTAALSVKGEKWKCFACGEGGDIFDLVAKREGLSLPEATRWVMDKYGGSPAPSTPQKTRQSARDLRGEVEAYHAAITGSPGEKYLNGRGITAESIARFRLGYDRQRQRVVIPYNRAGSYYGMRSINPDADHAHDKPAGVTAPLFNEAALAGDLPCYVVESPLCAISIMQECAGAAAVALGGCNIRLLQDAIRRERPRARLILALDNDPPKADGRRPGQDAQRELAAWLAEYGVPYTEGNVAGEYKDPNEALQAEREAFSKRLEDITQGFDEAAQRAEEAARNAYMERSAEGYMDAFLTEVSDSAANPPIPTGYAELDKLLDGGLYAGLYTLGAVSSLGKTSFVLQLCDQLTAAGQDVIYVALEMAREELIAKSVSRITYAITANQGYAKGVAKTTRGILTGARYAKYSPREVQTISDAIDQYKQIHAPHMWIVEGVGGIGVAEIRKQAEEHIRFTGRKPVVVVDYLQLLSPPDVRASDKQNTDRNVLELKRMSRDLRLPVVAISSLNRDNYTEPINIAAFKESGAIEYGSDCLIGLQYVGMEYRKGDGKETRTQRIRELFNENDEKARNGEAVGIEIKVMKNRNGGRGFSAPLAYTPMFNTFSETPAGWTMVEESPVRRL
ncbi:MAG: toprim domain-containing protein [Bacteroidaceae bacterium]|nr:toprim domain-containing protein [Bacteroidaceae bacterium]